MGGLDVFVSLRRDKDAGFHHENISSSHTNGMDVSCNASCSNQIKVVIYASSLFSSRVKNDLYRMEVANNCVDGSK